MTEPKETVAASVAEAEGARPTPKSAEDAKAAKALESMEGRGDEEVKGASAEDLGNASKVLSTKKPVPTSKPTAITTKVDAADVAEVVEQMEVCISCGCDASEG